MHSTMCCRFVLRTDVERAGLTSTNRSEIRVSFELKKYKNIKWYYLGAQI